MPAFFLAEIEIFDVKKYHVYIEIISYQISGPKGWAADLPIGFPG
jgi:hypothetical protein